MQAYRTAVADYKTTNSKDTKKQLEKFLVEIKLGLRTALANNDPMRECMSKLRGTMAVMQDPDLLCAKKVDKTKLAKLQKELEKLEQERADIEANKVYEGAFEWRFEFPEVLDEEGKFKGFDVVFGNCRIYARKNPATLNYTCRRTTKFTQEQQIYLYTFMN